ncbi:MAG: PilZ domain-containing protein [Archangiaceae bacterium]|nr:PilZ domain-containing protein [Archangiaceae bacterium]
MRRLSPSGRSNVVVWSAPLDDATRSQLQALGLEVVPVAPEAARRVAAERAADAVVAPWADAWSETLTAHDRPIVFVHLGPAVPQGLLELVVAGGNGWVAASTDEACARLASALGLHRVSERFPVGESAVVVLEQGAVKARLLDCSSHGLAFWVPSTSPIDAYAHGVVLEGLGIEHAGQQVLVDGVVRVHSLSAQGEGFRVGCQFQLSQAFSFAPLERELLDPVRALATVARACRAGAVSLLTEQGVRVDLAGGHVDALSRRLQVSRAGPVQPFDVVRCSAQLDDSRYDWQSAVVSADPLTLRLPVRLDAYARRSPARRKPQREGALHLTHPLSGRRHQVPIVDFTPSGARVDASAVAEPFPPGLLLGEVELTLDGPPLHARAEVRHRDEAQGHLGLKLEPVTPFDAYRSRLAWVFAANPELSDGRHLEFDAVWEFCTAAGLVTPEVAAIFAPLAERARLTQRALARDDGQLFSAIVRSEPALGAYLSAFRAYQHTWYLQHLGATTSGMATTADLIRAIGELCEQTPDAHYFQVAWYLGNPFVSRSMGAFARRLERGGAAVLRVREHRRVRTDSRFADEATPSCRRAVPADAPKIISLLALREPGLVCQAMDLDARRLWLAELDTAYQRVGLGRRREVLVSEHQGAIIGVALCELSSVGINFRELASVARLSLHPSAPRPLVASLGRQLAAAACRLYREHDRPFALLCGQADEAPVPDDALLGAPFSLAELTGRKDVLRDFKRLGRLSASVVARPPPRAKR